MSCPFRCGTTETRVVYEMTDTVPEVEEKSMDDSNDVHRNMEIIPYVETRPATDGGTEDGTSPKRKMLVKVRNALGISQRGDEGAN